MEGKAEGIAEGSLEKARNYAIKLLTKKFKALPSELTEKIMNCNDITKLDQIPEIIFDISDLKEIQAIFDWLSLNYNLALQSHIELIKDDLINTIIPDRFNSV